jgi:DNA-binding MarR family transcriptional regulator
MAKNRRQPTFTEASLASRPPYTHKQGQYLAFIHCYQKLHRRAPAETDLQQYFRVSPPSVHDMILRLEEQGLIARVPGQARSIRILLPPEQLPELES